MLSPTVVAAALCAAAAAPAPAAQANPLVGTWKMTYPVGTRVENGAATVISGTGTLVVEAKGDSLVARLKTDPVEGRPARPETRMAAKATAGEVVFEMRSPARVNVNGEERDATSVSTWMLRASGDVIEGTVARRLEGSDLPPTGPLPVTGTRAK